MCCGDKSCQAQVRPAKTWKATRARIALAPPLGSAWWQGRAGQGQVRDAEHHSNFTVVFQISSRTKQLRREKSRVIRACQTNNRCRYGRVRYGTVLWARYTIPERKTASKFFALHAAADAGSDWGAERFGGSRGAIVWWRFFGFFCVRGAGAGFGLLAVAEVQRYDQIGYCRYSRQAENCPCGPSRVVLTPAIWWYIVSPAYSKLLQSLSLPTLCSKLDGGWAPADIFTCQVWKGQEIVEVENAMIQLERFYGNGTTPCLRVTYSFKTFELTAISTLFQGCQSELTTLLGLQRLRDGSAGPGANQSRRLSIRTWRAFVTFVQYKGMFKKLAWMLHFRCSNLRELWRGSISSIPGLACEMSF